MKVSAWLVLVALVLGAAIGAGIVYKCCGPDPAYWVKRSAYDAAVKTQETKVTAAEAMVAAQDKVLAEKAQDIATRDKRIAALENLGKTQTAETNQLAADNAKLRKDAQAAIDANPAVKALVANYDLRCVNYERQLLTLAQKDAEKDKKIDDQAVQIVALTFQRDTWKKSFDDEHALRIVGDSLRLGLERQINGGKFWKWAGIGGTVAGVIAGYLAHK